MAEETVRNEQMLEQVGQVVSMGPLAYKDQDPYCQVGDWVLVGQYAGVPVPLEHGHAVLVNDDEIKAVLTQPDKVRKRVI